MDIPHVIIYSSIYNNQFCFDNLYEDDIIICPFCMFIGETHNMIKYADIQHNNVMLTCVYCYAKSVIIKDDYKLISKNDVEKKLIQHINGNDAVITKDDLFDDEVYIAFKLAKILKISNYQLRKYIPSKIVDYTPHLQNIIRVIIPYINEYMQFGEKQSRQLIDNINLTNIINKFNLIKIKDVRYNNPKLNKKFWNIALPVMSYDINKPIYDYPARFNFINSGTVYLLYETSNGKIKHMAYW